MISDVVIELWAHKDYAIIEERLRIFRQFGKLPLNYDIGEGSIRTFLNHLFYCIKT
jgi:hypothetical protein